MEYSRTTGFCLTSTILVAADANAEDVRGEGDDDNDDDDDDDDDNGG